MLTLPRRIAAGLRVVALAGAVVLAACTITPPPPLHFLTLRPPPARVANLDQYRTAVADRVAERNPSAILQGAPQAMLRSLVVVAFTVDRDGQVTRSSVYRSNGDSEAEQIALASLRRSAPLPPPPAGLLDRHGEIELMESWLFNDNGKFQLRSKSQPQAQSLE